MATITLGTASTTTLTAVAWGPMMNPADLATISRLIKVPAVLNPSQPRLPGAFVKEGLLYIPSRFSNSPIRLQVGDVIGVDSTGWPIVLSAGAAASASWVHT